MKKVLLLIVLFFAAYSFGQAPLRAPYSLGFEPEDSTEISNWVLNPGTDANRCKDQWMIGTATRNGGKYSLYISCDSVDAQFAANVTNIQYVYRDFTIPAGNYEISFDYNCMGSSVSELYAGVSFKTALEKDMKAKYNSTSIPSSILASCPSATRKLKGSTIWKNASMDINANQNAVYRVFFMWVNSNNDTTLAVPMGACIDNIQITSKNCAKPKNLTAEVQNDSVFVSWQGTSEQYIFERRKRGTETWYKYTGLTDKSLILEGLNEGAYDFRVRGVCNDIDTSAYAYLHSLLVYYPERHCIDYVHINDSNIHGTIGSFEDPYQIRDTICDQGADNKMSRHTVNIEPDTYDPRTGNHLSTIPDGEFASIRLGNWNVNAQAESMSFDILVEDESQAILLIKYAVVMQDPNHSAAAQPRFKLEILDEYDNLIDPTCGAADFIADITREGWYTSGTGSSQVTWKDWTTLGLNLQEMDLIGKPITVRFTTYDCSMSGHYGYAYFMLDCASAKIYGLSCGSDSVMTVSAPIGFDYAWYDKNDNLVCKTKELSVLPSDTTTYRCHLSYKESPDCGFDLYSSSKPRYPVSDFEWKWYPSECRNKVRFTNKSHILVDINGNIEHYYDEPCDEIQWDFGEGMFSPDDNPVVIFPNEGGTFPITLYSSIAEGRCVADTTINVVIPAIGDIVQTIDTAFCQGGFIYLGDSNSDTTFYAAEDGTYQTSWKSVAGCDSTLVYNVKTYPVTNTFMGDTTICADQQLSIDGTVYNPVASGSKFYVFYTNQYGCDSTIWMNVHILDSILPTVKMVDIDGDKEYSGEIHVGGTGYTYYMVNGTRYDTTQTAILGLNGGEFTLMFFNDLGCYVEETVYMTYPCRNLIFQRWNDVLSVYNSETQQTKYPDIPTLNYTSFQWMKDSVDIPGAVLSYYYEEGGLDMNSFYQVRVITVDGEILISCPFYPEAYSPKKEPKIRKVIENNEMIIIIDDVRYNAQGRKQ